MRHAKVFGWGAVETEIASWDSMAVAVEIAPRLWVVRVHGKIVGAVGKDPWFPEAIKRTAARLCEAQPDEGCEAAFVG